MAGGTWDTQTKRRPGVYINYKSAAKPLGEMGSRGTVCCAHIMPWGAASEWTEIDNRQDIINKTGLPAGSADTKFLRLLMRGSNRTAGAQRVLLWSLPTTDGTAASASIGNVTFVAAHNGAAGNTLSISIETADNAARVQVLRAGEVLESVECDGGEALPTGDAINNALSGDWVTSAGDEACTAAAPTELSGGVTGSALADSAYHNFLTAAASRDWDVICYAGAEATVKAELIEIVQDLCAQKGKKCQGVIADYDTADAEYIINVKPQAVTFAGDVDNISTSPETDLVYWIGGSTAAATASQALTYCALPGAISCTPRLTDTEQIDAINAGSLCVIEQFGKVQVLQDINSLHTFTADRGKAFRKNRVVRTVFGLCNDIYKVFAESYIGVTSNDEEGRLTLKAEIYNLLQTYQGVRAVQNIDIEDITVEAGEDIDAVVIGVNVQPVDSVEKLYINITII